MIFLMPLPQQVVEQLGQEPERTHAVASGALMFCGGLLVFVAALYFGIGAYASSLQNQINSLQAQVTQANAAISPAEQQQIIGFYSQITNLKTVLGAHEYTTGFLSWLEKNTQSNVFYQGLNLTPGGKVILHGIAKTEADVNQQIAIFENSPQVANTVVSTIAPASQSGGGLASGLQFSVTLTMQPSVFASATP